MLENDSVIQIRSLKPLSLNAFSRIVFGEICSDTSMSLMLISKSSFFDDPVNVVGVCTMSQSYNQSKEHMAIRISHRKSSYSPKSSSHFFLVASFEYFASNHRRQVAQMKRPNSTHENCGWPSSHMPSANGLEIRWSPEFDAERRCRTGTQTVQRLFFSDESTRVSRWCWQIWWWLMFVGRKENRPAGKKRCSKRHLNSLVPVAGVNSALRSVRCPPQSI